MATPEDVRQVDLWKAYERLDDAYLVKDEVAIQRELSLIAALQRSVERIVEFPPLWRVIPRAASSHRATSPSDAVTLPEAHLLIERDEVQRRADGSGDVSLTVRVDDLEAARVLRMRTVSAPQGQASEAATDLPDDAVAWFVAVAPDTEAPSDATGTASGVGGLLIEDVREWLRTDVVLPLLEISDLDDVDDDVLRLSVRAANYDGRNAWRAVLRELPSGEGAANTIRTALRSTRTNGS